MHGRGGEGLSILVGLPIVSSLADISGVVSEYYFRLLSVFGATESVRS